MSDISQITIDGTTYDVKDAVARNTVGVGYGNSTTSADQRDKVVSVSGYFETREGYILVVGSTNGNTYTSGSVRLKVNSMGAAAVYAHGAITSSTNPLLWPANSLIYFVYVGGKWVYMGMDADAATPIPTDLKKQIIDNTVSGVGNIRNLLQLQDSSSSAIGQGVPVGISSGDNITLELDSNNDIKISATPSSMPWCFAIKGSYSTSSTSSTITTVAMTTGTPTGTAPTSGAIPPASGHISDSDYFEVNSSGGVVCKKAGYISVAGSLYINGSNLQCGAYIFQNSLERCGSGYWSQSGGAQCVRQCQGILPVAANDVIYIKSRSSSSSTVAANWATYLKIEYLEITE